ncbi:MAG: ATP-binding protein [Myxococcota bacterium]|jgi:SpoVK/Ycf46/Vps4 family AAA+-type ATPase|nr:ATP-binding protein [Myxococcota bacterium]
MPNRRCPAEVRKPRAPRLRLKRDQLAVWVARRIELAGRASERRAMLDDASRVSSLGFDLDGSSYYERDDVLDKALVKVLELAATSRGRQASRSDSYFVNIERLGELFELSRAERELLCLLCAAVHHQSVSWLIDSMQGGTTTLSRQFAAVLNVPVDAVRAAISPSGFIVRNRLASFRQGRRGQSPYLDGDLADLLSRHFSSKRALLDAVFRRPPRSPLDLKSFPDLAQPLRVVLATLRAALEGRERGINILLYGPPGTGKTELTRVLGKQARAELFEVSALGPKHTETAEGRLVSYLLAQEALSRRPRSLVVFDEAEDVMPRSERSFFFGRGRHEGQKAHLNGVLEDNPVPALWVANDVSRVEPSFLRRFSLSVEVNVPPRPVRRQILESHLGELKLDPCLLDALSERDDLAPAEIGKAARVARLIAPDDDVPTEVAVKESLSMSLALKGKALALPPLKERAFELEYDLASLRASEDLPRLVDSLHQAERGAICLYGPPGTGKTAFAKHLATTLGRTLVTKLASDLLSMWVGGTEANLRRMFRSVDPQRDILLLDEADSFFHSRAHASHGWEVTQVNELLVQMERFEGLFLCSTNLIDNFDQAAFRRFALKIRFDYPALDQCLRLFQNACRASGHELDERALAAWQQRLEPLATLAPGDFAAVLNRTRLTGKALEPEALLERLEEECAWKPGARQRRVGF